MNTTTMAVLKKLFESDTVKRGFNFLLYYFRLDFRKVNTIHGKLFVYNNGQ